MTAQAEQQDSLRGLSDPDLIAAWAEARLRLALGQGSKQAYERARTEYERRIGRES